MTADSALDEKSRLQSLIEQWKEGKEEQPVDAVVDPTWKAIPGYNGRGDWVSTQERYTKSFYRIAASPQVLGAADDMMKSLGGFSGMAESIRQ